MNLRDLRSHSLVLPDSTSSKSSSLCSTPQEAVSTPDHIIMGKNCNLFDDVKDMNPHDPLADFFLSPSNGLPIQEASDALVTSSSPKENTSNEDFTLLPLSSSFILTDSSSSVAPTLILNTEPETPGALAESSNTQSDISVPFGEIYTLTLGDGTAVQLRVQTCDEQTNQQPITLPEISSTSELVQVQTQPNNSLTNIHPPTSESIDWNGTLEELPHLEFSDTFHGLISRDELILTKSQKGDGGDSLNALSSEASLGSCNSDDEESLISDKTFNDPANVIKYGKMDLELFRNEFNTLPDGQLNLEAILKNADVDMSVDEIVKPTLTSLKKIMSQKKFSDWQIGLCLKIRRRKKNTAAVRSSRRKRVQYMSELKQHVSQLTKRRKEAELENSLLKQLKFLWERLVQEVETEVAKGTKNSDSIQISAESVS